MFLIKFYIDGFPIEQVAGPYTTREVAGHRTRIEGFEGVRNVTIVDAPPKKSENSQ